MKNLTISCKGIGNISFTSGDVDLEEVDMRFLEDLDSTDIIYNHNNQNLLEAMDADEITEWYENKYNVKVTDLSRDVD